MSGCIINDLKCIHVTDTYLIIIESSFLKKGEKIYVHDNVKNVNPDL